MAVRRMPHRRNALRQVGPRPLAIILVVAVAWLSLWVHELHRVPAMLGLTPDASLPLLVILVALLIWWLRAAHKRAPSLALLIYALVNAVGGFLSVLPLPILPFVPEQTVDHYLVHVIYSGFQVPLIVASLVAAVSAGKSTEAEPVRAAPADADG